MTRPTLVLLHAKEIPDALKNFFTSKEIKCVTPDQYNTAMEITHLVMTPQDSLKSLNDQYQTVENDIRLLCLAPVTDMTAFLESNGRLVVDPAWFKQPMGKVILEKFFLGRASVHLDQNFPAIKEHGGFKVTNHLRIGHDMDRLAAFVHARNASLVNIRTFVDHALYYSCYLAQAKIGSAPFDVDYGFTGSDIVVQVHLPVRRYLAENLLGSFHLPNGSDPIRYLLSICVQSADFTEVQYIEAAGKVVISGFWQNREGTKALGFSGLLVNHVRSVEQIERAELLELTSQEVKPSPVVEATEAEVLVEKPLPGEVENPPWDESTPEAFAPQAPALAPVAEVETRIKGDEPQKELTQVVKGGPEEKDNFQQKIGGDKTPKDNFQVKIGGADPGNDQSKTVLSSGKEPDQKNASTTISSGSAEQEKGGWAVKSTGALGGGGEFGVGKSSGASAAVLTQLKDMDIELKKTKGQLELATKEIKVFREMRKQMMEIEQKFKESQQQGGVSSEENLEALDAVNKAENDVRKAKLELQQKQIFFAQELEKSQRLLKARDLVIEKAKDSVRMIAEKKDLEIKELQAKLDSLGSGQTAALTAIQQVKTLEMDKQSLSRLVDVYKTKLTVMTAKAEKQLANPAVKEEELRKTQMDKQTAQVALAAAQKDIAKLKSRTELDQAEIKRLNEERIITEQKLKAATALNANMPVHVQNSAAEESLNIKIKELEKELGAQTNKASKSDERVKDMEKKVADLTASLTKAGGVGDSNLKTKVAHLDAAVKKMTQDLTTSANQLAEAKKEMNKLRQEKTALQNQLDKLKKDADRANKDKEPAKKAS